MKTLLFLLFSLQVHAKTTVIAVIDTGFGTQGKVYDAKLCKFGHRDFSHSDVVYKTQDGTLVPGDTHGHGTHIAGLVNKYAKEGNNDYCIVVLKYYDPHSDEYSAPENTVKAIKWATAIHADYINYSGGGSSENLEEDMAVKEYLDKGGTFVSAAGNERSDLAVQGYFPAMADKRVVVVGNVTMTGTTQNNSNYGTRVNCWEMGTKVDMYGANMTGTSQSTAIATGKMVAGKTCNHKKPIDKN